MRPATTACPRPTEWLRLVDGEQRENRAVELRDHAAGCPACSRELATAEALVQRIAATVPGLPSEGAIAAVMVRLDEVPWTETRRPRRPFLLGGAIGLAAAAALLLTVRPWQPPSGEAFFARGGEEAWARRVGVELWALEKPLRRLLPGVTVALGTPLVASYSNADQAPAWLLAFALDATGEVHWLYPAYLDPASDTPAARLEPSTVRHTFADSAVLEGLEPGAVRFVFVVSPEPLRVSHIERLLPAEREPDRLRARWPRARIDVLPATIVRGAGNGNGGARR